MTSLSSTFLKQDLWNMKTLIHFLILFLSLSSGQVTLSYSTFSSFLIYMLVNHNILISRISSAGISDFALQWFKSYLTNGHQFIKKSACKSSTSLIRSGVPQGSVLCSFCSASSCLAGLNTALLSPIVTQMIYSYASVHTPPQISTSFSESLYRWPKAESWTWIITCWPGICSGCQRCWCPFWLFTFHTCASHIMSLSAAPQQNCWSFTFPVQQRCSQFIPHIHYVSHCHFLFFCLSSKNLQILKTLLSEILLSSLLFVLQNYWLLTLPHVLSDLLPAFVVFIFCTPDPCRSFGASARKLLNFLPQSFSQHWAIKFFTLQRITVSFRFSSLLLCRLCKATFGLWKALYKYNLYCHLI